VNNTTIISTIAENPPLVQEILLDRIVESPTNPRRMFDERKLLPTPLCGVRLSDSG